MRRIFFALSMLASTPFAYADLIENYSSQEDVESREQQNRLDTKKSSNIATNVASKNTKFSEKNAVMQWLKQHPLPNTRMSSDFGERIMFGKREGHSGVDFAAPTGTPIFASGSGLVVRAGWVTGYGQFIEINHGNGYLTRYGHASRLLVKVGDRVDAGDEIAKVGCTGRCTGAHLHYEIVLDGKRKNPETYLAMLP
ncbi:hypothetical protein P256_01584 [Acinetobacter nectaris CIP 110549]|uniref:M23ase beta-sheet core domain-containing protein n=1 Tax=Acinetobacter nectaris CIP 110549 TaxID=1392540 RepID=V2TRU3_9GAMM|nr:M23 family metallopeptidase [Acinetobacter nectaris]ESK38765.1 hypothetical protein P256_01584 [Acinetobacter nectaris CIP 110549]